MLDSEVVKPLRFYDNFPSFGLNAEFVKNTCAKPGMSLIDINLEFTTMAKPILYFGANVKTAHIQSV